MPIIPTVKDRSPRGEKYFDLFSKLLNDRVIMITEQIDDQMMGIIVAQLLYLEAEDSGEPIHIYISSPGGSVMSGLAILDTMELITAPVYTYAMGMVASMAAVLFACGEKGHRYIMPNAEVMIHQPLGGTHGQASDIEIQANHIISLKKRLYKILAKATGKHVKTIEKESDRDNYFEAAQAIEFGLADTILKKISQKDV
ncbi:MAG: ATP-dependent Clp protease proteolytic subunit [Epsilonproteobacteria bacterium]|nr:ATP-dependent Clp protease proteolytic subunit [Campylobacterota bacterium]OIO16246.1 MAG: ATP-dependent Clp protease proteolytic subunit [Helicobacteraceae bacterium CG1_02_36_14]PIP09440.1 MAG: ATP-dependent Clp protease proteolytic subunit [Sulfurimonas sp. CG23_combo_of_CG06-09_8_20_14_all_36_33]PIS24563.1 MAG: ATP-dependent Clp protease proteolytic subunit [Sulfurimonas sp. CG08_land_8_20_14_0_20_36_33]PIU35768.1 MAG: ATP-dependent Clp protease proteolytic subunit [Sulfurimonas sp. CG07